MSFTVCRLHRAGLSEVENTDPYGISQLIRTVHQGALSVRKNPEAQIQKNPFFP
jgi:hypothetical protein